MIDLLDTLIGFNDPVLRNTVWIDSKVNVFDDLSHHPIDWSKAELLSKNKTVIRLTEHEVHYQAIEYVFDRENRLPSRFSDGTFPAWYGSLELETTFYETNFHWRQTFLADAGFLNTKNPIYAIRTVFETECASTLVDIRSKIKKYPFLVKTDESHRKETQSIGLKLSKEGFPGLLTLSARVSPGTNVVVFNKKILQHPKHKDDYLYAIFPDAIHETVVMNYDSREILLKIG